MAVTLETSWKQILTFTETIDGYSGNVRQTLYAKYSRSTTQLNNLQSTISWELRTKTENGLTGAYYNYSKAYSITSKETSESSNTTRYSANINQGTITTTEKVLASGEWTQNHSSDGTCNVKINYSGYCYSVLKTGSVDVTLPNIAVNPTLTITSVGNMTTSGASVKYTLGNTNGRSTKIQYSTNGTNWVDWKTKTADGTYTETLPNLLSSYKDSYTNTIYFRAYISSTISSGSKSKGFSIDPSIKANISSVTVTADNGSYSSQLGSLFVQTISKPKIKTNGATAGAGATLKQYDLTALSGYNAFSTRTNISAEYTYPTEFQKSGSSFTATVRVKDSRGDASAYSKSSASFKVVEYYNPSIQNVKVQRCTSNGTLSDTGTYCKLSITYKIAPITSGSTSYNTKSLKYKIGSGSWTKISISSYNTTITQVIGGSLSTNSSYQISVQLQDLTTTVTQVVTLPTSFVLVSKHTGGKGIAFGKIAESNGMEVNLDTTFMAKVNGVDVSAWERYFLNRKPHKAYDTSTGNVRWHKILRIPSSGGYATKGIVCMIASYTGRKQSAIFDFSSYHNQNYKAYILCGNINASDLGYIVNSDNTVDIYVYSRQVYTPIMVMPLEVYTGSAINQKTEEWDVWNSTYPEMVSGTPTLTDTFTYTTHS